MENKMGVRAAIPTNPKRCLILMMRRFALVKCLTFLPSNRLSLKRFHHFIKAALKKVNTTFPKKPPLTVTAKTFKKLKSNKITALGIPTFPKKMALEINTESIFKKLPMSERIPIYYNIRLNINLLPQKELNEIIV